MRPVLKQSGTVSATAISRARLIAGRDRRRETPAQARHFVDTMRGLFSWAADAEHVRVGPTAGVKYQAQRKSAWRSCMDGRRRRKIRGALAAGPERAWRAALHAIAPQRCGVPWPAAHPRRCGNDPNQKERGSRSPLQSRRRSVKSSHPAHVAVSPSSAVREASRSRRSRSAICPRCLQRR
jgi:hypothetical protein